MYNRRTTPAVITAELAAGSTASPFSYDINIVQKLCTPCCKDETPVFSPTFTYEGVAPLGNNVYLVTIHVEGVISYVPCDCCSCCTHQQNISQDFSVAISSTTAPSEISIVQGTTSNGIATVACQQCSKTFVSDTSLQVTVTTT